jgi:hypothetical protein
MGVPARAAVEAPEGGRASDNGAQPRPRYQQAATFVDAARQMVGMRLSALRLPPGRRRTLKRGAAKLGRYRVARTISFIRPRAVKRSGGGGPPEGWWRGHAASTLAARPTPLPPPCGIADAPHRRSRGRNGDRRPPMPPPRCAGRDAPTTRRPRRLRPANPRAPGGRRRGAYSAERLRSETGAGIRAPGRRQISGCLANARGSW